jgi:hypothetical protein
MIGSASLGPLLLFPEPIEGARALRYGLSAGGLLLDEELANYGWDTSVRPAWAVTVALSGKRHSTGLRISRSATTQSFGDLGGEAAHPDVSLTAAVGFAELDALRFSGFDLSTLASVGMLHAGYSPDQLTFDVDGGESLSVEFEPLTEPVAGVGLAIGRALGRHFEVDLRGERSWFWLDTSHRRGEEIVNERRSFGTWTIALGLSRSHTFGGLQ